MLPAVVIVLCIASIGSGNHPSHSIGHYDAIKNIVFVHSTGVKNISNPVSIPDENLVFHSRGQSTAPTKPVHYQIPYLGPNRSRPSQPLSQDYIYRKMESEVQKRYTEPIENIKQNQPATQIAPQGGKSYMVTYSMPTQQAGEAEVINKPLENIPVSYQVPTKVQKQFWYDPSMAFPSKNQVPYINNQYKTKLQAFHQPQNNKSNQYEYVFNKFFVGPQEKVTVKSQPFEQMESPPKKESENFKLNAINSNKPIERNGQQPGALNIPYNKVDFNTPWFGFKMIPPSCLQCAHLKWLNDYYSVVPQNWKDLNGPLSQGSIIKPNESVDQYKPSNLLNGDLMIRSERLNLDEDNRAYPSVEFTTQVPNFQKTQGKQSYLFRSPRLLPEKSSHRVMTRFGPEDARALTHSFHPVGERTNDEHYFDETASNPKEENREYNYQDNNSLNNLQKEPSIATNLDQPEQLFLNSDWRPVVPYNLAGTLSYSYLSEHITTAPSSGLSTSVNNEQYSNGKNSTENLMNEQHSSPLKFFNTGSMNFQDPAGKETYSDFKGESTNTARYDLLEKRSEIELDEEPLTKDQEKPEPHKEDSSEGEEQDSELSQTGGTKHQAIADRGTVPPLQIDNNPAAFGKEPLPKLQRFFRIFPITGRYEEYFPSGFR